MKRIAILAVGIATLTASGVEPVGVKVDLIAKPASAVTVPIESVTVSEADILRTAYDKVVTRQDLIAIVRGNGSEENRLRALNQIWDQDDVFLLLYVIDTIHHLQNHLLLLVLYLYQSHVNLY